jgi:hypothetical protein
LIDRSNEEGIENIVERDWRFRCDEEKRFREEECDEQGGFGGDGLGGSWRECIKGHRVFYGEELWGEWVGSS